MDLLTKEIIRSWNWPSENKSDFSKKPTPYNISKNLGIGASLVYKRWKNLFETGFVKKVILLPHDSLVGRQTIIFSDVEPSDWKQLLLNMENAYFLEKAHFYHTYDAHGTLNKLKNPSRIIMAELINSAQDFKLIQAKLLLSIMQRDIKIIDLPHFNFYSTISINQKLIPVIRKLSYSNLYALKLKEISPSFNISTRTLNRWMNLVLKEQGLRAFSVLDQAVISGFNTFVLTVPLGNNQDEGSILRQLMRIDLISHNYLAYRIINGLLNVVVYYDFPNELDKCVDEISGFFNDYAIFYRHQTYFNQFVRITHLDPRTDS